MKTLSPRFQKESASVLVYALILMVVAGVVLAGWMHLLATRALYTEQLSESVRQRIVLENSRLMATEYLLENVLPGSFSAAHSASLSDNWGGFSLTAPGSAVVPLTSETAAAPRNLFSPGMREGFKVDIVATLSDGISDLPWLFQARSATPMFGNNLLTSQKSTFSPGRTITIPFGVAVNGNTVIWSSQSPNSFAMKTRSYQTPTVNGSAMTPPLNGGGVTLVMSNFAFVPVTSGIAGGGLGYDGSFAVVEGASGVPYTSSLLYKAGGPITRTGAPPHISVYSDADTATAPNPDVNLAENPPNPTPVGGVSSDGDGIVTIDLDEPGTTLIYIYGDMKRLVLNGSWVSTGDYDGGPTDDKDAGTEVDIRNSLLIVCVQPTTSTREFNAIKLNGSNNRRVYLAVKKEGNNPNRVNIILDDSELWRLGAVFENTRVQFNLDGHTLQLVGGVRSDARIQIKDDSGAVDIFREQDPRYNMTLYADRFAWLENYRQ